MTPETFTGYDQPGAALTGDATKPAAKQPAMVKHRNYERGACVRKRLVAPPNIIDLAPHPAIFISVLSESTLPTRGRAHWDGAGKTRTCAPRIMNRDILSCRFHAGAAAGDACSLSPASRR